MAGQKLESHLERRFALLMHFADPDNLLKKSSLEAFRHFGKVSAKNLNSRKQAGWLSHQLCQIALTKKMLNIAVGPDDLLKTKERFGVAPLDPDMYLKKHDLL